MRAVDHLRTPHTPDGRLRYDLDPTLRINDFYASALAHPDLAGLETFVSGDRGTDTNNLQPGWPPPLTCAGTAA